ncbi:MAG: addiction module protein [Xanthomonadales bacterium]|nr:addiction module protein [Xanthomonadales bacterium]
MNLRVDHVLQSALRLSSDERSAVAAALIDSLQGNDEPAISEAWREELCRRRDELRSGKTRGVPWPEVRERLASL